MPETITDVSKSEKCGSNEMCLIYIILFKLVTGRDIKQDLRFKRLMKYGHLYC